MPYASIVDRGLLIRTANRLDSILQNHALYMQHSAGDPFCTLRHCRGALKMSVAKTEVAQVLSQCCYSQYGTRSLLLLNLSTHSALLFPHLRSPALMRATREATPSVDSHAGQEIAVIERDEFATLALVTTQGWLFDFRRVING